MKRWIVPVVAAAVLTGIVVGAADLRWRDVSQTLTHLDPGLCLLAFVTYFASYVFRGLRLTALLPGARGVAHLTSVCARHILLAVVLPFRTGEAALPVLLHREAGRPLSEAVAVLGVMRVLDLLGVAVYLLAGLALSGSDDGSTGPRAAIVFALLSAGLLAMRPVCRRLAPLASAARRPLAFLGQAASHVAALRGPQLASALLTTLLAWGCTYTACYVALAAMAGPQALPAAASIGYAASLVGTTGLHLAAVMPLSPVASVGTWEAGWTAGYTLVGLPAEAAAASAIVSHVLIFAFIVVIGLSAFAVRRAPTG